MSAPPVSADNVEPTPPSEPGRSTGVEIFLWSLLVVVIVGLVGIGVWSRVGTVRAPLPVIAEVPDFSLTNYDGRTVTRDDLAGAPWIADFIFTRCPAICPRMTSQMQQVAAELPESSPVRIVSVSVDPEHDTPEVLAEYARAHGALDRGAEWYFLTGEPAAIYSLSRDGFLLPIDPSPPPEVATSGNVIHSNRFALVDSRGRIRGYYDPFDPAEVQRLLGDVDALIAER